MYDFAIEVLKRAEASADEGSLGDIFTTVIEQAVSNLGDVALGKLDALPGKARKAAGDGSGRHRRGRRRDRREGAEASELAGDAWKAGLKEAIAAGTNKLGGAISLAEIAVYLKGGANKIAEAWTSLKDGVKELPTAIKELILPKLVAAEREFKKQLRALANAAYGRAVEILVDQVEGISVATDAAETNVGVKEEHLKTELEELKKKMAAALTEVGGEEGAKVAATIESMSQEDVAAFAMSGAYSADPRRAGGRRQRQGAARGGRREDGRHAAHAQPARQRAAVGEGGRVPLPGRQGPRRRGVLRRRLHVRQRRRPARAHRPAGRVDGPGLHGPGAGHGGGLHGRVDGQRGRGRAPQEVRWRSATRAST